MRPHAPTVAALVLVTSCTDPAALSDPLLSDVAGVWEMTALTAERVGAPEERWDWGDFCRWAWCEGRAALLVITATGGPDGRYSLRGGNAGTLPLAEGAVCLENGRLEFDREDQVTHLMHTPFGPRRYLVTVFPDELRFVGERTLSTLEAASRGFTAPADGSAVRVVERIRYQRH